MSHKFVARGTGRRKATQAALWLTIPCRENPQGEIAKSRFPHSASQFSRMPLRPAISSMSLGRAWVHKFPAKLDEAAKNGFQGIEIFMEDLEYLAKAQGFNSSPRENLLKTAPIIKHLCDERDLTIICLQPFMYHEGCLDRVVHAQKLDDAKAWFQIAHICNTDIIQIPSSFIPADQLSGNMADIVADMREIADLGAKEQPPIRFAYEALSWGTHVDTWEQCWEIIKAVDRPNFGIGLDTFNIAGRAYADPASETGKTVDAEKQIEESIKRLVTTLDPAKIFTVQIVDAERLEKPLIKGHEYYNEEQPARMSWSRNCRLFYGEEDRGAYLPVRAIAIAIIEGLGFDDWLSMELFSRTMNDPRPEVPGEHAKRGMASYNRISKDIKGDWQ